MKANDTYRRKNKSPHTLAGYGISTSVSSLNEGPLSTRKVALFLRFFRAPKNRLMQEEPIKDGLSYM
ncbi:hypothetical protein E1B06_16305 [Brevibacillus laterosporus]|nr:hypothetical protein [Brevibacillus laterosporus]